MRSRKTPPPLPKTPLPLNMVAPGQEVALVAITGGRTLRKRLADLGLNVGSAVRVMRSDAGCPLLLAVCEDSRLALGRGIAQKIMVAPCPRFTDGEDHPEACDTCALNDHP